MNREYERRVVQLIVPFPNRQFLMDESLNGNITEIEGLVVEVSFLFFFFF